MKFNWEASTCTNILESTYRPKIAKIMDEPISKEYKIIKLRPIFQTWAKWTETEMMNDVEIWNVANQAKLPVNRRNMPAQRKLQAA